MPSSWPLRGNLEQYLFWASWMLALAHAMLASAPVAQARPNPAWRMQCWAITIMAVTAVLLNWITTGDHLLKTLRESYWPVAGMDLFLLSCALIAALTARRLKRRSLGAINRQQPTAEVSNA